MVSTWIESDQRISIPYLKPSLPWVTRIGITSMGDTIKLNWEPLKYASYQLEIFKNEDGQHPIFISKITIDGTSETKNSVVIPLAVFPIKGIYQFYLQAIDAKIGFSDWIYNKFPIPFPSNVEASPGEATSTPSRKPDSSLPL